MVVMSYSRTGLSNYAALVAELSGLKKKKRGSNGWGVVWYALRLAVALLFAVCLVKFGGFSTSEVIAFGAGIALPVGATLAPIKKLASF
jgi:hypothetical protein